MNPGTFETITVVNIIHTGAAFGVHHGTGANCYIPASVLGEHVVAGDEVSALLVDNPNPDARDRTPYMARFVRRPDDSPFAAIKPTPAPEPEPEPESTPVFNRGDVEAHVRREMKAGGVWTTLAMFRDYLDDDEATRDDNLQAYNAVSTTLRKMFDDDECAKWSMWTRKSQTKVGREWFSCHPKNVEVAEWEDE